ncbi:hypothetical protein C1637_04105 [Chryseobacterium lactis]|uniref:Uncharacterized protein n=1 Tax=Chryseobacterium lactis TaxID=1241981 RepID=A0A3G6RPA6_CHRLC|nr:hypothetical protein [Chryseobacterium lactis]AZA81767.1 hypothetical protein EG342_07500 [Chryseobacterium lactis]AZB06765.1 hypothetical protein EG341_23620 [Chryseobacterium lactis]PNW15616.1 hypothetical protein C1637_04105 [Chryseobacterium lactis]
MENKNAIFKTLFLILYIINYQSCIAQKKGRLYLTYKDIIYDNNVIDQIKSYNSKTGIYEVKEFHNSDGYKSKSIIVNLTEKNVKEIYDLYLKLRPKNLHNCVFINNNKLISSSTISFNKNKNTESQPCNIDWEDKEKYDKIEAKLYEFILPTYRLKYPNDFVGK